MTRGASSVGTLLVAAVAGGAGLLAGAYLRDKLPDSLKESPVKTGLAVAAGGIATGALLNYMGFPTAGIATAAALGGAGAVEAASPLFDKGPAEPKSPATPSKGAPGGGLMPVIGPVSPALPQNTGNPAVDAQNAIQNNVNTLLGWIQSQVSPGGQNSPGAGAYPTFPQLPNGYQDPLGAAQGIYNTIAQHTVPASGSGGGGAPLSVRPDGGIVMPNGEVVYPGNIASDIAAGQVGRVVRMPVGRVVRLPIGCVQPSRIGRVVAVPRRVALAV